GRGGGEGRGGGKAVEGGGGGGAGGGCPGHENGSAGPVLRNGSPSNAGGVPSAADGTPAGVRLVDFGLAALLDRDRSGHRGTPGFAAPEVVRGVPLSVASDLYSLGATLFVLALIVARGI